MSKNKKKNKRKIVYVKWVDASTENGDCNTESLDDVVELESAGLLIRETNKSISLGLDYAPQWNQWRTVLHIPKINITKLRYLTI